MPFLLLNVVELKRYLKSLLSPNSNNYNLSIFFLFLFFPSSFFQFSTKRNDCFRTFEYGCKYVSELLKTMQQESYENKNCEFLVFEKLSQLLERSICFNSTIDYDKQNARYVNLFVRRRDFNSQTTKQIIESNEKHSGTGT